MTLNEFFARARKVKWVVRRGVVRTKRSVRNPVTGARGQLCPLAYVTGYWGWREEVRLQGVGEEFATRVVFAADSGGSSRAWLKRQLGIAR